MNEELKERSIYAITPTSEEAERRADRSIRFAQGRPR